MGTQPGYWAVLPSPVRYDRTLTATAKLLYAEISGLMQVDGYCWATDRYFAELFGVSEATISRALRSLRDAGYIQIERQANARGPERHIYAGLMPQGVTVKNDDNLRVPVKNDGNLEDNLKNDGNPAAAEPVLELNQGNSTDNDRPSVISGKEESKFNPPKKQAKKAPSLPKWKPERFEAFWHFYPRGEGRQAAAKAWDKLRPDDALIAEMGHALVRQKRSEDWQEGIGIPHASTWLNGRRWEDELRPPIRSPADAQPVESSDVTYWTPEVML